MPAIVDRRTFLKDLSCLCGGLGGALAGFWKEALAAPAISAVPPSPRIAPPEHSVKRHG